MPTVIEICKCENVFQDNVYGKYRRVFNYDSKKGKKRCSSCGTVKDLANLKKAVENKTKVVKVSK